MPATESVEQGGEDGTRAVKEKARSPYVLRWQRGCTSSSLSNERNVLDGL